MDSNLLQKGDILLSFHKGNLISSLIAKETDSSWSHALLYIGNNQIFESTSQGVHLSPLSKYEDKEVYVIGAFRIKNASTQQLDALANEAQKRLGTRYGFFQIAYLWILHKLGIVKEKFWQREVDSGEDCVETIARAAEEAGLKLFDKNPSMLAPEDYAISDKFDRIF